MNDIQYSPDWREQVTYSAAGPTPTILRADDKTKVLIAGLEAGQRIPEHAEAAAVYHFLLGEGTMTVDGRDYDARPGATITMPAGAVRGLVAASRLAFLAVRIA
jgi:quercetin dioxygenase-like cupin family protein